MSLRLVASFGAGLGATLVYQEYIGNPGLGADHDTGSLTWSWLRLLLDSRRDGGAPKAPAPGGNDFRALTRRLEWLERKVTHPTTTIVTNGSGWSTSTTFALLLVVGAGAIWPFAWWYGWPERWAAAVNKLDGDLRDLNTRIVELFSKVEKESEQTRSRVEDLSSDIENARRGLHIEVDKAREDLSSDIENARRGLHIAIENIAELITHKHDQLMASSGEFAKRLMRQLVSWGLPTSARPHQNTATRPRQLQAPANTDNSPWTAEL